MTIVAGVPRFTCHCPDGRIKPTCLGPTMPKKSGCCCDGACCGKKAETVCSEKNDSDSQTGAGCCEHHSQPAPQAPAKGEPVITASGCTRTLVQPEVAPALYPEKLVVKNVSPNVFLVPPPAPVCVPLTGPFGFRHEHQRPPPTDLLTALHRLLI